MQHVASDQVINIPDSVEFVDDPCNDFWLNMQQYSESTIKRDWCAFDHNDMHEHEQYKSRPPSLDEFVSHNHFDSCTNELFGFGDSSYDEFVRSFTNLNHLNRQLPVTSASSTDLTV